MRFLCALLLLLFSCPAFAADVIYSGEKTITGRVTMGVDGLIHIKSKGIEKSYVRSKDEDYFGDYVKYRPSAFSSNTKEVNCRLLFVDFYNITFKTQDEPKVEIPRYRVKSIILNID